MTRHSLYIIISGLPQQKLQFPQALLTLLLVLKQGDMSLQLFDLHFQQQLFTAQKQPQAVDQACLDMLLPDRFRGFRKISHDLVFISIFKTAATVIFEYRQHPVVIASRMVIAERLQKIILQFIPLAAAAVQPAAFFRV